MSWPFMALLGDASIVRLHLDNADAAIHASEVSGLPLYILAGVMDHESGGKNIYGHDSGGVFSFPGRNVEVTERNYKDFYRRAVTNKETSNGVGPMQLTYRGYHKDMRAKGVKAWVPMESVLYGARVFRDHLELAARRGKADTLRWAATYYNAGENATRLQQPYADNVAKSVAAWKERLA